MSSKGAAPHADTGAKTGADTEADAAPAGGADKVLILDFGSQYTQLIARRVRELHVYSEIMSCRAAGRKIADFAPRCIILSGGPESVGAADAPPAPREVFELGVPVLGICYGMQTMARQLGGEVAPAAEREFGAASLRVLRDDPLFAGLGERLDVWMSHGDRIARAPDGFETLAASENSPVAAMADPARRLYGLQFHPEVTHTPCGAELFARFVVKIAGCRPAWTPHNIVARKLEEIRATVGDDDEVVLALSGGVDSSVLALLLRRALGARLHCVFIDSGLLRHREAERVREVFERRCNLPLIHVDAGARFFEVLAGVVDPEEKRRRIGALFVELFEAEAARLPRARWLAQGTIYPDVIESSGPAGGPASLIKSHHNVGGLPERMNLRLLEPLSLLFKDEVRALGGELGLPPEILHRHPFPGPGLAVRVVGEVREEAVATLRRADRIFLDELRAQALYDKVAQAFCVLLPVRSVGVMGDGRHYGRTVVLRAVETDDFMTARRAHLPGDFLDRVATRIVNEVDGVSRVCLDLSGKPPATIEWE